MLIGVNFCMLIDIANGTVNRILALIRAVLNAAKNR